MDRLSNLFCGGRKKKNGKKNKKNGGERKKQEIEESCQVTVEENPNQNGITVNIVADKVTIGTEEIQWKNQSLKRKNIKGGKDVNDGLEEAEEMKGKLYINPTNECDGQLVTANSRCETYNQADDTTAEEKSCKLLESGYGSKKEEDQAGDTTAEERFGELLESGYGSKKEKGSLEVDGPNRPYECIWQPIHTGPNNNVEELRDYTIVSDRLESGSDTYVITDHETGVKRLSSTGRGGSNKQINISMPLNESSGVSDEQCSTGSDSVNSVLSAIEGNKPDRNEIREHGNEMNIGLANAMTSEQSQELANGVESEQSQEIAKNEITVEITESQHNQDEISIEDEDGMDEGDHEIDAEMTTGDDENKDDEREKNDTEEEKKKMQTGIHAINVIAKDIGQESMEKNFIIAMRGDNACKIVNGREIGCTARELSGFIRDIALQQSCF